MTDISLIPGIIGSTPKKEKKITQTYILTQMGAIIFSGTNYAK